jgi:hypothetical protein
MHNIFPGCLSFDAWQKLARILSSNFILIKKIYGHEAIVHCFVADYMELSIKRKLI